MPVPIVDDAGCPDLMQWLRSDPLQQLMTDLIDELRLVRVSSYSARAFHRPDAHPRRSIRLNAADDPDRPELVLLLCHELGHHVAGLRAGHSAGWRVAYAELVKKAGGLGLLTEEQVSMGMDAALWGPATAGFDWREHRRHRRDLRHQHDRPHLQRLLEDGVRVGSRIGFRFRGRQVRATVTRINRRTVTANAEGERLIYRIPFSIVRVLNEDE